MCNGQSIDDYVDSVQGMIERHGWALQYVNSDDENSDPLDGEILPAFCYTVGLTTFGHPEIVLVGRAADESAAVLNALGRRVSVAGERFDAGIDCRAAGFELSFVDVVDTEDWLLMADRIYAPRRVEAVQAVWRDFDGNLPWEGQYPSTLVQPVLGAPPGWYDHDD